MRARERELKSERELERIMQRLQKLDKETGEFLPSPSSVNSQVTISLTTHVNTVHPLINTENLKVSQSSICAHTHTFYCLVLLTELFSLCFRLCPFQRRCPLQCLLSVHPLPRIPCYLPCYSPSLRSLLLRSRLLVNCCHCQTYRCLCTQYRRHTQTCLNWSMIIF